MKWSLIQNNTFLEKQSIISGDAQEWPDKI